MVCGKESHRYTVLRRRTIIPDLNYGSGPVELSPRSFIRCLAAKIVALQLDRMPIHRLLVMRLTEVEVYSIDLGMPGLGPWSDLFVDVIVPLRVAWLPRACGGQDQPTCPSLERGW
jgi:hypothetical protein